MMHRLFLVATTIGTVLAENPTSHHARTSNPQQHHFQRILSATNCRVQQSPSGEKEELCQFDTSSFDLKNSNASIALSVDSNTRSLVVCDHDATTSRGESWHGICHGDAGEANFIERIAPTTTRTTSRRSSAQQPPQVFGSVRIGDKICRFFPNAYGEGQVVCQLESLYPPEHPPVKSSKDKNTGRRRRLKGTKRNQPPTRRRAPRQERQGVAVVDIMVVWTKRAECDASGLGFPCTGSPQTKATMRGLVELAVAETNTAYELSGVDMKLRLVHAYRHPNYIEKAVGLRDAAFVSLDHVRTKGDGQLEDVHGKRQRFAADVVAMLISDTRACGVAYLGPRVDTMFSVTNYRCATGAYTFGHEIAHNFGCEHDRGTEDACTDTSKNDYGWRDPRGRFRSIMAYSCKTTECDNNPGGSCSRVQRFSGPGVKDVNGRAVGNAKNNNVARLNSQRFEVAAYYGRSASCTGSDCSANSDCCSSQPKCTGANRAKRKCQACGKLKQTCSAPSGCCGAAQAMSKCTNGRCSRCVGVRKRCNKVNDCCTPGAMCAKIAGGGPLRRCTA